MAAPDDRDHRAETRRAPDGEPGPGAREPRDELDRLAATPRRGLLRELWGFLRATGKWWLAPIIALLLLVAALVIAGGSGLAPFIYTLF